MQNAQEDQGTRLMLAYQAGEETAFDELVEMYSGRVYSLCTRFLGSVTGREDLVQEVFLRVIRARERYEPSARFSTWLYRIAFNLCANRRERNRDMASLEALADSGEGGDGGELVAAPLDQPWSGMDRADVSMAVREAILALPEKQRQALILAKYEDQSLTEIASVMEISAKAAKSLVHRAREGLRERLKPFLQQEGQL